jgi:hypothetical protein
MKEIRWGRALLVLLCACLLTACVGPQQLNTLSGYPEVFLPNRSDGPFVLSWIAAQNRATGLRLLEVTESRVVAARWVDSGAEARYTYSVAPTNRGMTVYLRHDLVLHPGAVPV